ncbi:hypothetical protein ACP70R_035775 [Stipagrostis hirtigluma subsp. patula]
MAEKPESTEAGDGSDLSLSLGGIYRHAPASALPDDGFSFLPVMPLRASSVVATTAMEVHPTSTQMPLSDAFLYPGALSNQMVPSNGIFQGVVSSTHPGVLLNQMVPSNGMSSAHPGAGALPNHMVPSNGILQGGVPSTHPSPAMDEAAPTKRLCSAKRSTRCRPSGDGSGHVANTDTDDGPLSVDGGRDNIHNNEASINASSLSSPPFPWATNRVGIHHSLAELSKRGVDTIYGDAQCKRCDNIKRIVFEVQTKFKELYHYILCNIHSMNDRAPSRWTNPALPDCEGCGQKNSMRPVISAEKDKINWIFLLLGEMLGLCTLEQLKHFCERTKQHRTGAKDRVLYSTYMELCNQLLPDGPFDMASERLKRSRPHA